MEQTQISLFGLTIRNSIYITNFFSIFKNFGVQIIGAIFMIFWPNFRGNIIHTFFYTLFWHTFFLHTFFYTLFCHTFFYTLFSTHFFRHTLFGTLFSTHFFRHTFFYTLFSTHFLHMKKCSFYTNFVLHDLDETFVNF